MHRMTPVPGRSQRRQRVRSRRRRPAAAAALSSPGCQPVMAVSPARQSGCRPTGDDKMPPAGGVRSGRADTENVLSDPVRPYVRVCVRACK